MFEEFTMEKKPSSSNQTQGKSLASDNKKIQDANKPIPKSSRRREPSGTFSIKYDQQNRKPMPQKNKTVNKKPRPRGQYHNRKGDYEVPDDDLAEYGSDYKHRRNLPTANELLNFNFRFNNRMDSPSTSNWHNRKGSHGVKFKYSKEQFLQANYQFVVKSESDLRPYAYDPDRLVEWNIVEQIRVPSHDELGCPICLSTSAVAAQMTRCGHVYCWSCILHYFALSDDSSRPCPICFAYIKCSEFKGVVRVPTSALPSNGDLIEFILMGRDKASLISKPINTSDIVSTSNIWPNISDPSEAIKYSKILLATPKQVVKLNEQVRIELEQQLKEEKGCPEACFIEQALQLLNKKESEQKTLILESEKERKVYNKEPDLLTNAFKEWDINTELSPDKCFFFYQVAGGGPIFLHGLSVAMLVHTYGTLANCPTQIKAKCIERESLSVTHDFRKRHRNLSHLPVGCQLEMVVLDLKPPLISPETQNHYGPQLKERNLRRKRKEREEQKLFDKNDNRHVWSPPPPLESSTDFPQCGFEPSELPPLPSGSEMLHSPANQMNPDVAETSKGGGDASGPSFAQMLRQGQGFSTQEKSIKSQFPTINDALMIALERKEKRGKKNFK